MKKTKEQLVKECATLEEKNSQLIRSDLELRTQFSDVLGAGSVSDSFYGKSTKQVYTWYEIFCRVGKLLQIRQDRSQEEQMRMMEERNVELHQQLLKKKDNQ